MIAIVDYGVGNLFSLKCSFGAIGSEAVVTGDEKVLRSADKLILPGVGAFGDAAEKLRESGLAEVLVDEAKKGKPLLGICLGMQLLFDKSFEYGEHEGLHLIPGEVRPLEGAIPHELKIPQMGWNALEFTELKSPIYKYTREGSYVYFVHSYYGTDCENSTTAVTDYGAPITASVQNDNVFGCQFHPEKSGSVGLEILKAFCEL